MKSKLYNITQITVVFRCACAYTAFLNTYIFLKYLHVIVTVRALTVFTLCKLHDLLSFREVNIYDKIKITHSTLICELPLETGFFETFGVYQNAFILTYYFLNTILILLSITLHTCYNTSTFVLYVTIDLFLGNLDILQLNNNFQQLDAVLLPYLVTASVLKH